MVDHVQIAPEDPDILIGRAARTIAAADHLLITAGAGMGVDSGLPDYRGRTSTLGSGLERPGIPASGFLHSSTIPGRSDHAAPGECY